MIHIKSVLERSQSIGAVITLLAAAVIPVLSVHQASALSLTNRSLMVTSTNPSDDLAAPDGTSYTVGASPGQLGPGDPRNGTQVGHTYKFTTTSATNVHSFTIEYCDSAFGYVGAGACAGAPTGFSAASWASGGTAAVKVGATTETWNVSAATANTLTLTEATTSTLINAANAVVEIKFTPTAAHHFVNPDIAYKTGATNGTYFAHVISHNNATPNSGVTDIDEGTVTNSVTTSIGIYTRVQETLNFSVEGDGGAGDADPGAPTDADPGATGACDPLVESGQLKMGDTNNALRTTQAYNATSYFRLATNSSNGAIVYYSGDTLKSGANTIAAIADTGAASTPGTEQFGLAFNGAVGNANDLNQLSTIPTPYANSETAYAFNTGSVTAPREIARSAGIVECATGDLKYVANISTDTPAGIYQTKINYIASPTY